MKNLSQRELAWYGMIAADGGRTADGTPMDDPKIGQVWEIFGQGRWRRAVIMHVRDGQAAVLHEIAMDSSMVSVADMAATDHYRLVKDI